MTTDVRPIEKVLSCLRGVKQGRNGKWIALCPTHQDNEPSLMVSEDEEGRVSVHCFAGCTPKGAGRDRLASFLEATGLFIRDLFPDYHAREPEEESPEEVTLGNLMVGKGIRPETLFAFHVTDGYRYTGKRVVKIPYFTEDGTEHTRFRLRISLEKHTKRFSWGGNYGVPPIAYGLNWLHFARDKGFLVLVEGETDVWTLLQHSYPALGIPGADHTDKLLVHHLEGINTLYIIDEQDQGAPTFVKGIRQRLQEFGYQGTAKVVQLQALYQVKDPNELNCQLLSDRRYKEFPHVFQVALDAAIPLQEWQHYPSSSTEEAPLWEKPTVPPLLEKARLPEGFLPQHYRGGEGDTQDWHDLWDDSRLKQVSPFLAHYMHYSYQLSPEGYVDFHLACALWILSTVAGRRIYVDVSGNVYTPLTVALVARTSLFAKSRTASTAVKMLKAAALGWLLGDDETTPQKMLSDMSGRIPANYSEMNDERKERVRRRIAMSGQIGWYYDEFNQLIEAMTKDGPMKEFAGLLRKMDDCRDEYTYSTRAHGQEIIEKPYLALLANTNPANLRKHATKGDAFWNDGFWARFAFITPAPGSFRTKTAKKGSVPVPEHLASTLRRWNDRLGVPDCEISESTDPNGKGTGRYRGSCGPLPDIQVEIDDDAYSAFVNYRETLREMIATGENEDLDGSYSRLSDKALRVATLIASLENNNKIDMAIWVLAQEIAECFRRNLHEFYSQVNLNQSIDHPLEEAVIDFLKTKGSPSTIRDIRRYGPPLLRKLSSKRLEEILKYLEKSGLVLSSRDGKKEYYDLSR